MLGQIGSAETLNSYLSHAYVLQSLTVMPLLCKVVLLLLTGVVLCS